MSEKLPSWARWVLGIVSGLVITGSVYASGYAVQRVISSEHRMTVVEERAEQNGREHGLILQAIREVREAIDKHASAKP